MDKKIKKIVLAYSGGLDTSVILPWLKEKYNCQVVAMAADVGQGDQELRGIEKKALASGASKCVVADLKREFAEQYCFKMLAAGAVYESSYLMGTSIARPLSVSDSAISTSAQILTHRWQRTHFDGS
jgi:argininosuccinate synthase